MERISVTMQPLACETRLLVMAGRHELMRAVLGPATAGHPRAAATRLEGLSLWHQQALSVVVRVGDEGTSAATRATGVLDDLLFGQRSVHYDVEVAFPGRPRRGRRIQGFGDFADLRQLCIEGVTP